MSFVSKAFQAVGNAVVSVVKGVVSAVTSVVKAVVNVVSSVVGFVTQPFLGQLGGVPSAADVNQPSAAKEEARQQGVLVQTEGSNVNIPVVYGYRKVGGTVVFAETGSSKNKYFYVAYVFSEGPVEGLREVYIDDWLLPTGQVGSLNAGGVVTVNSDRYKDRVQLQWFPGTYFNGSSNVGSIVKGGIFAEAPSFKSSMNFNGLAVLFARYEWKDIVTQADADSNPFSGATPKIQVGMLGRRVASLLTDETQNVPYDSNSVRYSTNPAEILLDYLRNPRYGKGLKNEDIHWDTWKKAARKCNQTVTYVTSGIQGPILTCNHVLDTGATLFANVKTLLMGFRAYMPYIGGRYKLKIEDAGSEYDILSGVAIIVATFNKDNIVGNIQYTGIEKSAKYNVVNVSYVDPDQKFSVQQVIYPETEEERQVYIDKDGGRENKLDVTFPTITNYAIAKDMARLLFNKSRRQETCSLTVTSQGLELEPGDNIRIQSNILNFGTDPWRVVSIKINDNMTVDLGCVRNPDDIYPHARYGEEDIVLPVYIPRGSIIYYPNSENRLPLGLVPPTNAVFPDQYAGTPEHPPSTDPEGVDGGGVGGGGVDSGPIIPDTIPDGQPETPPTVPTSPDNNPAPNQPAPKKFSAALKFKSSKIVDWKNGTFSFNTIFTQPDDAMYSYSIFWWRPNVYTAWIEQKVETRPGPGGDVPINLGPLPRGTYDFYLRSYATDGQASTTIVSGQLSSVSTILEQNPNFNGISGIPTEQTSEGWQLPPTNPNNPYQIGDGSYKADIAVFSVTPKLTAGVPSNPRKMTVSIQQVELITAATPLNALVDGVTVYFRLATSTKWSYQTYKFPAGYFPGQVITFDLNASFGAKVHPAEIIPYSAQDEAQKFYWLARLTYKDGKTAQRQLGPARSNVETFTGSYNFIVAGTSPYSSGRMINGDVTDAFNATFETTDSDPVIGPPPPGGDGTPTTPILTGDSLTIVPIINSVYSSRTASEITFLIEKPAGTRFKTFRVRYRPTEGGEFSEANTGSVVYSTTGKLMAKVIAGNYAHNKEYEWVITAEVIPPDSTAITNATYSLVGRGTVLFDDPSYANLSTKLNFTTKLTTEALKAQVTEWPATNPTIIATAWLKRQTAALTINNEINADVYKVTGQPFMLNRYYELNFQSPSTITGLIVYRRVFNTYAAAKTTVLNTAVGAKYTGLGPWERVRIPVANLALQSDGKTRRAYLRGPIDPSYFNPKYQVPAYPGEPLVDRRFNTGKFPVGDASADQTTGIFPYYGAGNNNISATQVEWCEFLCVLEISNVEQTAGVLLKDFYAATNGADYRASIDGFGTPNAPKIVVPDVSVYNTIEAGYGRRLSEALTGITVPKLWRVGSSTAPAYYNGYCPTRLDYGQAFTFLLTSPISVLV